MSYGIEVFNENNGKLIISENYSGMHYIGDASYVSSAASGSGGLGMTWLSNQRKFSINTGVAGKKIMPFVVNASGQYSCIEAIVESSSGVYDIYIRSGDVPTRVLVFDTLGTIGSASPYFGMEVFRSDGSKAFDTTRKPMWLRGAYDLSGMNIYGGTNTISVTSLTTPAIFCPSVGVIRHMFYGTLEDVYTETLMAVKISGTTMSYVHLAVCYKTEGHLEEANPAAPEDVENAVVNATVTIIDASIY